MNPNLQVNNIITPHLELELSFAPGRIFRIRRADLMFESWCQDNYTSVNNFFNLMLQSVTDPNNVDAKVLTYAVTRAFYHLISRDDQIFLRDNIRVENPLDEDGNDVKLTVAEKLMYATSNEDIGDIAKILFAAKGYASPNEMTEEEKKKKKAKVKTIKK